MKAVQLVDSGPELGLRIVDVPAPMPNRGELLIRVHAAGVTPTELLWYPTTHKKDGGARTRAIPGHEFSGVIAALGPGSEGFNVGDQVYGMNDWFADGATAEFCLAPASSIAPKPLYSTHAQAAAIPIGALTAWQGLVDRANIQPGERLLLHGAAGAVGLFVVQLARQRGAEVFTTASRRNENLLLGLGAAQVIDYTATPFEQQISNLDVIFDCVGGDTLHRSWNLLRPGGRMVTIAADSEAQTDPRIKDAFFIVEPSQQQLIQINTLLDSGSLRVFVDGEIPITDAPDAYTRKLPRKLGYGKTVVIMQ
jgi:NADPH:quinone reductase-like Zn-dependent oxidoreductase